MNTTLGSVWAVLRECENAYRHYGDVMLGLIEARGGGPDLRVPGLSPSLEKRLDVRYPPNQTCPTPPVCDYTVSDFKKEVTGLAGLAHALSEAVDFIVSDLPDNIKIIKYHRTACVGGRPTGTGSGVKARLERDRTIVSRRPRAGRRNPSTVRTPPKK